MVPPPFILTSTPRASNGATSLLSLPVHPVPPIVPSPIYLYQYTPCHQWCHPPFILTSTPRASKGAISRSSLPVHPVQSVVPSPAHPYQYILCNQWCHLPFILTSTSRAISSAIPSVSLVTAAFIRTLGVVAVAVTILIQTVGTSVLTLINVCIEKRYTYMIWYHIFVMNAFIS